MAGVARAPDQNKRDIGLPPQDQRQRTSPRVSSSVRRLFPQFLEETYDASHSLGVGLLSFGSRNHFLDRLIVQHETGRSLLGIIMDVFRDETRVFLIRGEFAIDEMFWGRTDPF